MPSRRRPWRPWSAGQREAGPTWSSGRWPRYSRSTRTGQPLVIKNVPGAAGVPGITEFMSAKPDGYTILHWNNAHVIKTHMSKVPFTATSFTPGHPARDGLQLPHRQGRRPVEKPPGLRRGREKNPNTITIGNAGAGGGNHMAALLFEGAAGIKLVHVPYQGGGPSVTGLLSGDVKSAMNIAPEGVNNVIAGQLRILAVFGDQAAGRHAQRADRDRAGRQPLARPVARRRGPPNTPAPIVQRLHDIFKKCIEDPEFVEKRRGSTPRSPMRTAKPTARSSRPKTCATKNSARNRNSATAINNAEPNGYTTRNRFFSMKRFLFSRRREDGTHRFLYRHRAHDTSR